MAIDKKTIERPFRFGPRGIAVAVGVAARESKLIGILGIQATTPGYGMGELSWDTARGSRLDAMRNASASNAFEDIVIRGVEDALFYGLPEERIDAVGGEVTDDTFTVNIETVSAQERGNTPRIVAKAVLSSRR